MKNNLIRPNFFIVGAPRCGTTALYRYLRQHPQVFMPDQKEPHYFNLDMHSASAIRDESAYLKLFSGAEGKLRVGEASVYYLSSKRAAFEIKRFSPEARIIIMLRNPADVMYAMHYLNVVAWVEDTENFLQALLLEEARKSGNYLPHWLRGEAYKVFYRELVNFPQQVQRYFDAFGRKNVHVIVYDDFKRDTEAAFQQTCKFLGITTDVPMEYPIVEANPSFRSRKLAGFLRRPPGALRTLARVLMPRRIGSYLVGRLWTWNSTRSPRPPLPADVRRRLTEELAPEIKELSDLLERDLSAWTQTLARSPSTAA
jgi:hypothetical protein